MLLTDPSTDRWLWRLEQAWLTLDEVYSHPGPYSLGQLVWSIDWLIELEYLKEENDGERKRKQTIRPSGLRRNRG